MAFVVEYKKSVEKELRKISAVDLGAIVGKIELLVDNPRPEGSAKLKGSVDLFRIRHGDYRVVYQIDEGKVCILIIRIGHRREIYKNL